jgi:cell division protein FtsB
MMKFKKSNYRFWHSPLALIILFCLLVFFGYKIIDLVKKDIETREQKNLALDAKDNQEKREASLLEEIAKLNTDEGKEEILREKYPVVKEGEKMVTIVNEGINDSSATTQKTSHGFWNWIKGIFGK